VVVLKLTSLPQAHGVRVRGGGVPVPGVHGLGGAGAAGGAPGGGRGAARPAHGVQGNTHTRTHTHNTRPACVVQGSAVHPI